VGFLKRLFGRGSDGERDAERTETRAPSKEDALAAYIIREHREGRAIEDILDDPYLKNRANEEQRLRLLERPDVIRAVGESVASMARDRVRGTP
jgi:hypothetical protein